MEAALLVTVSQFTRSPLRHPVDLVDPPGFCHRSRKLQAELSGPTCEQLLFPVSSAADTSRATPSPEQPSEDKPANEAKCETMVVCLSVGASDNKRSPWMLEGPPLCLNQPKILVSSSESHLNYSCQL